MTAQPSFVRDLRRIAAAAPPRARERTEQCDLCGGEIPSDHRHLVHLNERRIVCTCETCWGLLPGDGLWRPIGTRVVALETFDFPDELWARFRIPIGLAFFFVSGDDLAALYPSPAGATESELELDVWDELVAANTILESLEPSVEGLIVNRLSTPPQYAIAPIDECYRLVGLIRVAWQGISGGPDVEMAVQEFFAGLRETSA